MKSTVFKLVLTDPAIFCNLDDALAAFRALQLAPFSGGTYSAVDRSPPEMTLEVVEVSVPEPEPKPEPTQAAELGPDDEAEGEVEL